LTISITQSNDYTYVVRILGTLNITKGKIWEKYYLNKLSYHYTVYYYICVSDIMFQVRGAEEMISRVCPLLQLWGLQLKKYYLLIVYNLELHWGLGIQIVRIPRTLSEFRYRDPLLASQTNFIPISLDTEAPRYPNSDTETPVHLGTKQMTSNVEGIGDNVTIAHQNMTR